MAFIRACGGGGAVPIVPDGRTVTPINNVVIWQKCAGIANPTYSTLAEILADVGMLKTLMEDENAVDYLVRCKDWCGKSDTLVPIMTSDTTPSGVVTYSSQNSGESYAGGAYKAFANIFDDYSGWLPATSDTVGNAYIQYEFPVSTIVNRIYIYKNEGGTGNSYKYKLSASNDGITFTDIATDLTVSSRSSIDVSVDNSTKYKYYRVYLTYTSPGTPGAGRGIQLKFYHDGITNNQYAMTYIGMFDYAADTLLADADWCEAICNSEYRSNVINTENPIMTSNSAPSGYSVSGDFPPQSSNEDFYKAFDNDRNSIYSSASSYGDGHQLSNPKIVYTFPKPFGLARVYLYFKSRDGSTVRYLDVTCTIKGSNDGVTYETIAVKKMNYWGSGNAGEYYYYISIPYSTYLKYAVEFDKGNLIYQSRWYYIDITECKFYGRSRGTVQNWLYKAGITDKAYTDISDVLNDPVTLATLMTSVPAVDYLVTVKKWATEVCANATAMQYIGANNYAADILLEDSDWREAICNSTYFESVLNVKVPRMTSNTAPSGVASASSVANDTSFSAYKAFDREDSTSWAGGGNQTNQWVQYKFTDTVKLCCMDFNAKMDPATHTYPSNFTVRGSGDGTDFNKILGDFSNISYGSWHRLALTPARLLYVRTTLSNCNYRYATTGYDASNCVCNLQFYGRKDV